MAFSKNTSPLLIKQVRKAYKELNAAGKINISPIPEIDDK